MTKFQKYFVLLAIVSSAILFLLCFRISVIRRQLTEFKNIDISNTKILEENTKLINNLIQNSYQYNNKILSQNFFVLSENGEEILLKSLLSKNPTIIFHFSEFSCEVCLKRDFNNIKKICQLIGPEKIIIIGKFSRNRDLGLVIKSNNIKCNYYLDTSLEKELSRTPNDVPFVIISTEELKIQAFFQLEKNHDYISELFYKVILASYFTNENHKD